MPLETFNYIDSLNANWPIGASDYVREGDDHMRGIKATLVASFPNIAGPVTATHTELSYVAGVTSAIQSQLDGKSDTSHTHSEYALSGHTHSEYAAASHTHSDYALTSHTHTEFTTQQAELDDHETRIQTLELTSGLVPQLLVGGMNLSKVVTIYPNDVAGQFAAVNWRIINATANATVEVDIGGAGYQVVGYTNASGMAIGGWGAGYFKYLSAGSHTITVRVSGVQFDQFTLTVV